MRRERIIMYIKNVTLSSFRAFKNPTTLNIGKRMTAISGVNGVGKSTILAALVNGSHLKSDVKPLIAGRDFEAHFENLVIFDSKGDESGQNRVSIKYSDIENQDDFPEDGTMLFRAAKQKFPRGKKEGYRYRLIPQKIKGIRDTESKIDWPVLYLGLSRLNPVGEADLAKIESLNSDISERVAIKHAELMFISDSANTSVKYVKPDNNSSKSAGLETDSYSPTSNSSGQDNLTQILLAVESFRLLKDALLDNYDGGLLAIDEIDATLHPAVQFSLFQYLYSSAEELNLQIVFTTHSITLLEFITDFQQNNPDIVIDFIDRKPSDSSIEIISNPTKEFFRNNLSRTISRGLKTKKKVKVLTEDKVARDFLRRIIEMSDSRDLEGLDILDVSMGWTHLLSLIDSDYTYFKNWITILDPDTAPKLTSKSTSDGRQYSRIINMPEKSSVLTLPGDAAIEKMIWEFIENNPTADFWDDLNLREKGLTHQVITTDFSPNFDSANEQREQPTIVYKKWHETYPDIYDMFLAIWINNNRPEVFKFIGNLVGLKKKIEANLHD